MGNIRYIERSLHVLDAQYERTHNDGDDQTFDDLICECAAGCLFSPLQVNNSLDDVLFRGRNVAIYAID